MRPTRRLSITRRAWMAGAATTTLAAQTPAETVRLPRRIRLGLLGLDGHFGDILRPLPQLPDVEVVALSHRDQQKMARLARNSRLASAKQYTDYLEMLRGEQLDVVAVCNNNGERAAAIVACAERKLHVVAEKPLAIEFADLERVKQAVSQNGIRLSMLLPMRFSPPYLGIKQVVDSGEIGEVAQIAAQKSYKAGNRPLWMRRRASFGGTIPWIGIHMVDLMRWSSGREFTEAVSFQSHIGFPEIGDMENTTATLFQLDNGGVATLRMDYLRSPSAPSHGDDRLRLAGTKGVIEYQASTGVTAMSLDRKPEVIRELPRRRSLFADFLDSVYNEKPPGLSLADIYRVNEIVLAARESAEQRVIWKL
jgi:predicted dehydrogenase